MLNPEIDLNTVDYSAMPNAAGHFGIYGGRFAAETLMEYLASTRVVSSSYSYSE